MSDGIKRRVFLVGCPKSGTTLLQSCLTAHPQITSFPETNFFRFLIGQIRGRLTGQHPRCLRAWRHWVRIQLGVPVRQGTWAATRLHELANHLEREEFRAWIPEKAWSVRRHTNAFLRILDTVTLERGCSCWVEKTPGHIGYVREIERLVPQPLFINIVRDGAENVASLYDMSVKYPQRSWWKEYSDLDHAIANWNTCVRLARRYRHKKNYLVVKYERFVSSPESVLREVCDFIGVAFSDDMLEQRAQAADAIVLSVEAWKQSASEQISGDRQGKFDKLFDDAQKTYINERLEKVDF